MDLLFWIVLIFGAIVAWRLWQTKSTSGHIVLPNGHSYTYLLGDNLEQYRVNRGFHGIDIALTKELPHIYLDSLRGGGRRTNVVFDSSQMIALEGDFYRSYHVFVPHTYESLALSMLTPDVMQTLQQHAGLFDVEIYGDHLRIICHKRLFKHPARQEAVLQAAQKLLIEVDHRLQSWSAESSKGAKKQDLLMLPHSGLRIGSRYIAFHTVMLGVYWLMVTASILIAGVFIVIAYPGEPLGKVIVGLGVILTGGLVVYGNRNLSDDSLYSRRGWRPRK